MKRWTFGHSDVWYVSFCSYTSRIGELKIENTKIFEFVTSRSLFRYEPNEKYKLDETSNILHQMICYTCEDFSEEQLTVSPLAGEFFDSTCACT